MCGAVPVDVRDRRAGYDVVKLIQKHQFPKARQFGRRVPAPRNRGEKLDIVEQIFAAPIAKFVLRLGGVSAAVTFQI